MNRSLQNRELRLIIGKQHIKQIEKFVGLICDDNHIYDEYYANIIAANTMFAEYICKLDDCVNYKVDVKFFRDKNGLRFKYYLGELFLDIASSHEKIGSLENIIDSETEQNQLQSMMAISLLCDEIIADPDNEIIELFFRITGVNEILAVQRIELLRKYYSMIGHTVKQ